MYNIYIMTTTQKPYIQMFFKNPNEFINKRYSARELYDKSIIFVSENGMRHPYSIQEFGREITKLMNKYKKRTSAGIIYDLNINIDDFYKTLREYEQLNIINKESTPHNNPTKQEPTLSKLEEIQILRKIKTREQRRNCYQEEKKEKQELIHLNYMNFD